MVNSQMAAAQPCILACEQMDQKGLEVRMNHIVAVVATGESLSLLETAGLGRKAHLVSFFLSGKTCAKRFFFFFCGSERGKNITLQRRKTSWEPWIISLSINAVMTKHKQSFGPTIDPAKIKLPSWVWKPRASRLQYGFFYVWEKPDRVTYYE